MAFAVLFTVIYTAYEIVRRGVATANVVTIDNRGFKSAGRPQAAPATVYALGDGADAQQHGKQLARLVTAARPDRFLYLGDVYESGTASDYVANWRPLYRPLNLKTWPTPGNHEWGNRAEGYNAYWQAVTGHPTPPWYVVKIGGWEVLSLNTQEPTDADSPQGKWLAARLATVPTGTCRLAIWHEPRYSGGLHGESDAAGPLWKALQRHATLVFSGHDHNTQRIKPDGGLTQYVVGAGGRKRYAIDRGYARLAFADDKHYVAARIDLAPRKARVRLITDAGKTIDDRSYGCRSLQRKR